MKKFFWFFIVAIGYYAVPLITGLTILSGVFTIIIIHPDPLHSSGVVMIPCFAVAAVWILCRSWIMINQLIDLNFKS